MSRRAIAVLTADNHLDLTAYPSRVGLTGDAFFSFTQIIEYCQQQELPLVVAGDLLNHSLPPARVAEFLRWQLTEMANRDLPVYLIQGNHDTARPPWFCAVSDHATPIHARSFALGDFRFAGASAGLAV